MLSAERYQRRPLLAVASLFIIASLQLSHQAQAQKCEPTKQVEIKNRELIGQGCTEKEAKAEAHKKGAELCTGDDDPQCTEGKCYEKDKCLPIGLNWSYEKWECKDIPKPGCKGGQGKECKWTGQFHCGCQCQPPR